MSRHGTKLTAYLMSKENGGAKTVLDEQGEQIAGYANPSHGSRKLRRAAAAIARKAVRKAGGGK